MPLWIRRLRGVLGTGLIWGAAWALAGVAIGVASRLLPWLPWHVVFDVFDAPLPALAVPGAVGGVLFGLVVRVAGRRSRFESLSIRRFAAWGAAGGVLLSLVPAAMVAVGLATIAKDGAGVWTLTGMVVGPFAALGAVSAAGTLWIARRSSAPSALPEADQADALPPPMTEPITTRWPSGERTMNSRRP